MSSLVVLTCTTSATAGATAFSACPGGYVTTATIDQPVAPQDLPTADQFTAASPLFFIVLGFYLTAKTLGVVLGFASNQLRGV